MQATTVHFVERNKVSLANESGKVMGNYHRGVLIAFTISSPNASLRRNHYRYERGTMDRGVGVLEARL